MENGIALGQFVFANELQRIPEPSTLALFALGAACAFIWRQRLNRRRA